MDGEVSSNAAQPVEDSSIQTVDYSEVIQDCADYLEDSNVIAANTFGVVSFVLVLNLAILGAILAVVFSQSTRGMR